MSTNPSGSVRGRGRGQSSLPYHGGRGASRQGGDGGYRGGGGGGGGGGRGDGGGQGGGPVKQVFPPDGNKPVPGPAKNVTLIEQDIDKARQLVRSSSTSQTKKASIEPQLPQRPGFGTQGRSVVLWTNYFNMTSFGDLVLHRYQLDVDAGAEGKVPTGKKLKRVVQLFIEEHMAAYAKDIATDFKSILFSKTQLKLDEAGYAVAYRSEEEDTPSARAKNYRIRLQQTGTLTVSELMEYLTSTKAGPLLGSKEEIIQALNIIVGHGPKSADTIASIGANKHYETATKFDLGHGLIALRGFFVSVRAATARILVNVQVKHGAFYDNVRLDALMTAYCAPPNGFTNKVKLQNFLKRLTIDVTHISNKNKAGRRIPRLKVILGFATKNDGEGQANRPEVSGFAAGSHEVKFFLESSGPLAAGEPSQAGGNGKKAETPSRAGSASAAPAGRYISVFDFFEQTYNITIQEPRMPVINVGSRQYPVYLPAEVCTVIAGQPASSKLTASQTQAMIRFAVRKPIQNAQSIVTSGATTLGFSPKNNSVLTAFGLGVVPQMITVPGRVLSSPRVKYANNTAVDTNFGSWNMKYKQFVAPLKVSSWTWLRLNDQSTKFPPWHNKEEFETSLAKFRAALKAVGMSTDECFPGSTVNVASVNSDTAIEDAIRKSCNSRPAPKLLLVILPKNDSAMYNKIKHMCDVHEGVLNVCVVAEKFAKNQAQYFANVALKINLKLGGRNQELESSKLGIIAGGKTMVVGIDVTHPSPGSSSNAPSVASIVASVDKHLAQWPADLRIQTGRQEMVSDMEEMLKSRLVLWNRKNGTYPENIIVYRDGVSEGQYKLVLDIELPALRKACNSMYPASSTKQGLPRIAIIIVGKRHNTRFYPTTVDTADNSSNPTNGTVVDRGVTEARNWDFFLQAHTALQGTARPAHYYVVYDQIFQGQKATHPSQHPADTLEDLTHNMCYLFGRATKAVSICPPAYYADLACERARCYLSGLFDPSPDATPAASVSSGNPGAAPPPVNANSVRIHQRVKDAMFYI